MGASVVKSAANIHPAQQQELYGRVNPKELMDKVFIDYWHVFLTLVFTFNQNGKNIWWPTPEIDQQAANIFQNTSNPNFPQDKLLSAMYSLLKINPYNAEYYRFIMTRFGVTKEITAIKDYFGYTSFNDPRIC